LIPHLVIGYQHQQELISDQKEEINALQEEVAELKEQAYEPGDFTGLGPDGESKPTTGVLYQNNPNPFKEVTTIKYELPEKFNSASIMVFDMSGVLLETFPLRNQDRGQLTIEGRQFKPGMYLYALIVDNVEVDTKKMILNK